MTRTINEMAKIEQPLYHVPNKRTNVQRLSSNQCSHVDHIITIQGADSDICNKQSLTEQTNGTIHSTMDGLKQNMKITLPIFYDNEETSEHEIEKDESLMKNGYQLILNTNGNKEIIDLSPIYENLSDANSSHDDLQKYQDLSQSCKVLNSENNKNSLNSLSLVQSENSIEMDSLSDGITANKIKKKVNIFTEQSTSVATDSTKKSDFYVKSEDSLLSDFLKSNDSNNKSLTMSGTIKRGKKKGKNVDVTLNISREELEMIEASLVTRKNAKMDFSNCSLFNGPHIFLFTVFSMPLIATISAFYCFYIGTLTWYNIFSFITEEFNCIKKVIFAPILVLFYPFIIIAFTSGLGLYAAYMQLTFSGADWWKEVRDFEKGFYGWLCGFLHMPECSPYEVVILTDIKSP